jgi:hypothetical protein
MIIRFVNKILLRKSMLCGFPVTTAWHILRLRMEERPPAMEGSCKYIEQAAVDKQQGIVLQLGGSAWG